MRIREVKKFLQGHRTTMLQRWHLIPGLPYSKYRVPNWLFCTSLPLQYRWIHNIAQPKSFTHKLLNSKLDYHEKKSRQTRHLLWADVNSRNFSGTILVERNWTELRQKNFPMALNDAFLRKHTHTHTFLGSKLSFLVIKTTRFFNRFSVPYSSS